MNMRPQARCTECGRLVDVCNPIRSHEGTEPVYRKHRAIKPFWRPAWDRLEQGNCPNSRKPIPKTEST